MQAADTSVTTKSGLGKGGIYLDGSYPKESIVT